MGFNSGFKGLMLTSVYKLP